MDQLMTVSEIQAQFPGAWVLVEDPQTDEALVVQGGRVRYYSQDRDEVYRQAVQMRPKRFAMLYTGTMPDDTAIIL